MAIQSWDPLRDLLQLQEKMNRLFEDALARSSGSTETLAASAWRPRMDLHEESRRYVLRADLPGISGSEVDIQVEEGSLVLRGERRMDPAVDRQAYLRVERPFGRFVAQIALPPSVDSQQIQATYRNGVLEVILPKRPTEGAGRVSVPVG
jgi:HSP20 family protein